MDAPAILSALTAPARSDALGAALESVRRHLGMEIAYISEFVDGRSIFREVDAPGLEHRIKPGDSYSLDDVYCRHILAGRLPQLIPDTSRNALAASIPMTQAVPIGAHVSVPIRLPDGEAYGMFCCLSPHPNHTLNDRDLQVMHVFADMAARQIGQDVMDQREAKLARTRITDVIDGDAFQMVFQPILTFSPHRLAGFESLCRFTAEPRRTPDLWFNEAAAVGEGVALEMAVLRRVVAAYDQLPEHLFISLNASPATIESGLLDALLRDVPKHRLILEVTEHARVEDYGALRANLAPLRAAGARLAIDDAGAGYSSLQHIVHLQPDVIKLDMGLVRDVDADPARRALASALAFFARETSSEIVAEGIETQAEFDTLQDLGVTKGQGYFLGRPMPLAEACTLAAA